MISQKKRKELPLVEVAAGVVIRMRLIVGYPQMRTLFVVGVRYQCTQSLTCRCLVSPLWRVPESLCVTDLGRDVCIYVRRVEIESRRLLSWYSGWIPNHCSHCTAFFGLFWLELATGRQKSITSTTCTVITFCELQSDYWTRTLKGG